MKMILAFLMSTMFVFQDADAYYSSRDFDRRVRERNREIDQRMARAQRASDARYNALMAGRYGYGYPSDVSTRRRTVRSAPPIDPIEPIAPIRTTSGKKKVDSCDPISNDRDMDVAQLIDESSVILYHCHPCMTGVSASVTNSSFRPRQIKFERSESGNGSVLHIDGNRMDITYLFVKEDDGRYVNVAKKLGLNCYPEAKIPRYISGDDVTIYDSIKEAYRHNALNLRKESMSCEEGRRYTDEQRGSMSYMAFILARDSGDSSLTENMRQGPDYAPGTKGSRYCSTVARQSAAPAPVPEASEGSEVVRSNPPIEEVPPPVMNVPAAPVVAAETPVAPVAPPAPVEAALPPAVKPPEVLLLPHMPEPLSVSSRPSARNIENESIAELKGKRVIWANILPATVKDRDKGVATARILNCDFKMSGVHRRSAQISLVSANYQWQVGSAFTNRDGAAVNLTSPNHPGTLEISASTEAKLSQCMKTAVFKVVN